MSTKNYITLIIGVIIIAIAALGYFSVLKELAPTTPEKPETQTPFISGKVEVYTNRFMAREALESILSKHGLSISFESVESRIFEQPVLDVRKLDKKFTSSEWENHLRDLLVEKISIRDLQYIDGIYSDGSIYMSKTATDTQIDDYINRKGIEGKVYNKSGFQKIYIVNVPEGTEEGWKEKLMSESNDILNVRRVSRGGSGPIPL